MSMRKIVRSGRLVLYVLLALVMLSVVPVRAFADGNIAFESEQAADDTISVDEESRSYTITLFYAADVSWGVSDSSVAYVSNFRQTTVSLGSFGRTVASCDFHPVSAGYVELYAYVNGVVVSTKRIQVTPSTKVDIARAEISGVDGSYPSTGNPVEPEVTVTYEGETLVKDVDYSVSYENNVSPGTASIVLTGIGDYRGTVTKTFEILPPALEGLSLSPSIMKFTVGDTFDKSSLSVKARYSDGTTKVLAADEYQIEELDLSSATLGDRVLSAEATFTDNGVTKSADLLYTVRDLSRIEVEPKNLSFTVGQTFDKSQLVVTAFYTDDSSAVLDQSAYDVDELDLTQPTPDGETRMAYLVYNHGSVSRRFALMYTVAGLSEITVAPATLRFTVGDTLSEDALSVTAVYSDGSKKAIALSDCKVSSLYLDSATADGAHRTATVSYEEGGVTKTASFSYTVEERDPETVVMHRLYNRWTGEHFYTADAEERDSLVKVGWTSEGTGWVAPESGAPVYRLYNPYVEGGDHHYTMDEEEYDALEKLGWRKEGVGWYSGGDVEVYRQYNPYAATGTHNYTPDAHERDELVRLGWRDEGTGWHAVSAE